MTNEARRLHGLFRDAQQFENSRFDDYKELMAFYEGTQYELAV